MAEPVVDVTFLKAVVLALRYYRKAAVAPRALARLAASRRKVEPEVTRALGKWMKETRKLIASRSPTTPSEVEALPWKTIISRGEELLNPARADAWEEGHGRLFRKQGQAARERMDIIGQKAHDYAWNSGSKLIREITLETRIGVQAVINRAIVDGWGPAKTARVLRPLVGLTDRQVAGVSNRLTELLEGGMAEARAMSLAERMAQKAHDWRMNTIARTETNNSLRSGLIGAFRDQGVGKVEWVADPEACEVCAPRDGEVYTVDEYQGLMNPHPNCECTVVPAEDEPLAEPEEREEVADLTDFTGGTVNFDDIPAGLHREMTEALAKCCKDWNLGLDFFARSQAAMEQFYGKGTGAALFRRASPNFAIGGDEWAASVHGRKSLICLGRIFEDETRLRAELAAMKSTPTLPIPWNLEATVEGVMSHEFGHVVDATTHWTISSSKTFRDMIKLVQREEKKLGREWLSRYPLSLKWKGQTDRFYHEAWAEVFARYERNPQLLPKKVKDFIDDYKNSASWKSWTSSHPPGPAATGGP